MLSSMRQVTYLSRLCALYCFIFLHELRYASESFIVHLGVRFKLLTLILLLSYLLTVFRPPIHCSGTVKVLVKFLPKNYSSITHSTYCQVCCEECYKGTINVRVSALQILQTISVQHFMMLR